MQVLKLHSIKHTKVICEDNLVSELIIGSTKILKVLASPMIRSMWTLLLDIFRS